MNKHYLKRIYFLLVLMTLATGATFAQGFNTTNWKFSNPKQFGFTVLDVDYFDNNNAIAVGSNGGIAKTTDGGLNWTYGVFTFLNTASIKVTANFTDVHYVTSTVAYAVGSPGVMAKTTDGGATWNFVTTPLYANAKNINACWFVDAVKGYIGGEQNNTVDSLPKLYVTLNGGATWDSIAAPAVNGVSRVGYINNPLIPSVLYPVDAKLKEIFRIEFTSANTGYISGSNSYGVSLFPNVSLRATSTTVCTPLATFLTSGSMAAALLWKFNNGVLTDYSVSKERLGYFGINLAPASINCTSAFASITPVTQQYRAMNIYNDSTVVLMSFNNNTVVKVRTGVNDSTANVNAPGVFEKGKYEVLNFPSPPTAGPNAGPSIPNPQVLLASNPYQMRKTSNGTLVVNGNFGRMFKSVDTGRNWIQDITLPQGQNFSSNGIWAMDIAPNGRFLSMGANGVVADSMPGSPWRSVYTTVPLAASYNDMEFIDCNNGIAAGGAGITVTNDGGNTWIDRGSPVLAALNANITHLSYVNATKVYFTTSIGNIYRSANQAVNLSPVFGEPLGGQVNDLAWQGADSLWACGYSSFSVAAAARQAKIYRSFNNGAAWDTIGLGPIGALSVTPRAMDFPTRNIGYVVGSRNAVYKTTDAGATWTDISPFPALTPQVSYGAIQALNKDTIFVVGVGFPRKVVYRTTDGGANWTDITSNILTIGVGNLNGILMHDINNGYVMTPGGALLVTNNGGTSWTLDLAPTANLFTTAAFVPRTVGAGVNIVNRKMLVTGPNISGAPIMEYGNPANTQVNSTELITGAACTTPNGGSITITATGGLAPYTYQLGAGPFQASNVFSGLAAGTYTITIKDAYCGLLTKTVTIALTDNQVLNTNITTATVCAGVPTQLIASGNSTTYSWSPVLGLSNPNIANPIATPLFTTTYTVTATLNSCVKTRSITINVNPNANLVIVADPGTTLCEGDPTLLTVFDAGSTVGGTIPLNAQTGTFGGSARGYFFTAPTNFTMTALRVPTDASAGNQNVAVVRFTGATPPPAFPGTTNAFTTLFVSQNNPAAGNIPVNIAINTGDVIGILGTRGADVNSYSATPNITTIGAFSVPLTRMGMQFPLATTAPQQIFSEAAFQISRVFFDYTIGSLGPQSTGTFLWSPAAGLSSTTSNPVAASPMNTTTYTVVRTTVPGGCVASGNITITVNKRPTVTTQPVAGVTCAGTTTTFTVGGTGTGLTYQWQVSTAGCAGPWNNLTNGGVYAGVNTATLAVGPVTGLMNGYGYRCVLAGTCAAVNNANISNCAVLTVNPLPVVTITPAGPVCGGVAGISGTQLSTASTPPPVPGSVSVNSGTINLAVPDNTANGVSNIIAMSGVPANATITNVSVTLNMSHTYPGDMIYNLKAPNGQILSLYKYGTGLFTGAASGVPTWGWYGAKVSQTGTAAWSTVAAAPYIYNNSIAWKADAINTPVAGAVIQDPAGFVSNATGFAALYSTPASTTGNWTLAMCDGGPGDVGALASWTLTIDYTTPGTTNSTLSYVWSPLAGLYTNSNATTAYTGTNTPVVYAAPTVQTTYTVTATDAVTGCVNTASVLVNYTPPAPVVTPNPVAMCIGDLPVKLKSSSAAISAPAVWTPATGLFSNAAGSTAYVAGTAVDSVWAAPTTTGANVYTATVLNLITTTATPTTPMTGGNGNNLVTFNIKNNNLIPVTFSSISSNTFGSGAVTSRVFYKTTGNAGNPGPISVANGWTQFGTANNTVTAGTLNLLISGLNLVIPPGATYGIALDMSGATFPAYNNGTGTIATFSNGGCDIVTDGNVGWGGPIAPGTPANNPRNFNGSITFLGSGPGTCVSAGRTVTVTVNQPTVLNAALPANQTICTDKVATFTASVTVGTGPHNYQWQVSIAAGPFTNIANGAVYSGVNTATLVVTASPVGMSGYQYRCVIAGAAPCAAQTSKVAVLTVNPLPVIILTASPYTSLLPGLKTVISSTVTPTPAVTYTWLRNGVVVSGATASSINVDVDGLGDYQLRVTDVNGCTDVSKSIITIKDSASAKCFIYPNPNSGQFQVRYYSVAGNNNLPRGIVVYDAKGDRVFVKNYTVGRPYDRMDVDMRAYGKGLYWVEIVDRNGNRLTMCRVVIQ